ERSSRKLLVIGCGGCWGWRGRIGKSTAADGTTIDEKGPLPDLDLVSWTERDTIILFDANAKSNEKVASARRELAKELSSRGARVRIADVPEQQGVNGPDDYVAVSEDAALLQV